MKSTLALIFAVLSAAPLLGQEVMENFDFSDGTTHWHGDLKPAGSDSSTDFITSNSASPSGILVELHSSTWTRVTQEIHNDKAGQQRGMVLTITYQTSSDFKLSDRGSDYGNFAPSIGFGGAQVPAQMGKLTAFFDVPPLSRASVTNAGGGYDEITISHDSVSYTSFTPSTEQKPQTFSVQMPMPMATSDSHRTFCLAFPPGNGSVTITKISYASGTGGSSSSNGSAAQP